MLQKTIDQATISSAQAHEEVSINLRRAGFEGRKESVRKAMLFSKGMARFMGDLLR